MLTGPVETAVAWYGRRGLARDLRREAGANRDAGNQEYAAKREAYRQSGIAMTRRIAEENAEWSPERIATRQTWMADQATSIWRVAQLS